MNWKFWKAKPVFTEDEVASLEGFQDSRFHPLTCPYCRLKLSVSTAGLRCDKCKYSQDWALEFSKNWSWKSLSGSATIPVGKRTMAPPDAKKKLATSLQATPADSSRPYFYQQMADDPLAIPIWLPPPPEQPTGVSFDGFGGGDSGGGGASDSWSSAPTDAPSTSSDSGSSTDAGCSSSFDSGSTDSGSCDSGSSSDSGSW